MSSTLARQTPAEYFGSPAQKPQQNNNNNKITTFGWDSNAYNNNNNNNINNINNINNNNNNINNINNNNDAALFSSDESTLPSPSSPGPLGSRQASSYTLPKSEFSPDIKSDRAFNFGTFEDWMKWDDPSDAALSPTSDLFDFKVEPESPNLSGIEFSGNAIGGAALATSIDPTVINDESGVFGDDPITEEPLFQTPAAMQTTPITELPQEGLYSTPLAWSRPTPGRAQSQSQIYNILSPQQESELRDIAMPSRPQSRDQVAYPASPSEASSPEDATHAGQKRKSDAEEEDEEDDCSPPANGRHPPVKKTAHNMIEKRYRTNLNDKIAALRDSVPSLRVMSKRNARGEEIHEDLQGLTPAHKLNKATVLSKATEYISHLEKRNKYLSKENSSLKSRVDAFEILVMSQQRQPGLQAQQHQAAQIRNQQAQAAAQGYGGVLPRGNIGGNSAWMS